MNCVAAVSVALDAEKLTVIYLFMHFLLQNNNCHVQGFINYIYIYIFTWVNI